jgi:hypothetical protein
MRIVSSIFFCGTFFYTFHSFAMLTLPAIMHDCYSIRPHVYNQLSHKDKSLFRSVCKTWAHTNPQWFLMPDNVEKETDYHIKKYGNLTENSKSRILFKWVYNNDFNATQWILNTTTIKMTNIAVVESDNTVNLINLLMFAKSNDNKKIAQLLIKHQHMLKKDESWLDYYNAIIPPLILKTLLPNSQANDFTFLLYIGAATIDDNKRLQQLFEQQLPTEQGIISTITMCFSHDNINCFNFLVTHATAQKIIETHIEPLKEMIRKNNACSISEVIEKLYPTPQRNITRQDVSCIIQ